VADNATGSCASCPADAKSSAFCRAAAGDCNVAESCDGVNDDCPADGFASSSVVCRPAAGVCDVADNCTGSSATCPADAKSSALRREEPRECDDAEACCGTNDDC